MNFCSACERDFASVEAYDRHRVGDYPQSGPADWLDRVRAGLIEQGLDWEPSMGRRCLDDEELVGRGMEIDARNRWRLAARAADVRARFREREEMPLSAAADAGETSKGAGGTPGRAKRKTASGPAQRP